jgi:hypothetical protein
VEFGEVVDGLNVVCEQVQALGHAPVPGDLADSAVYHFYPSLDQARESASRRKFPNFR